MLGVVFGVNNRTPIKNIGVKHQGNEAGRTSRQRHETIHKSIRLRTRNVVLISP